MVMKIKKGVGPIIFFFFFTTFFFRGIGGAKNFLLGQWALNNFFFFP
jgi:hypothetical protein